ncbi:MAG: lipoprotein-releasing ABC transporter permease subunit [Gammaproteobacteria bacterium]|nr:lipoprotein-releasing ABC transporter permease subunit [Gammaproteobacteria bacterium]MCI0590173.1 lipoprotein-releasing ABC transporter permease subunit [Gammaproteobacteria bacterium]
MFKPFEIFIGLRYTRAKRRNHFISFISLISMLGVALGVLALITVLSVMNGFEKELRERILGMASHAMVVEQGRALQNWPQVAEGILAQPRVHGVAPFIRGEAMLVHGQRVNGVVVRGISPSDEPNVSIVADRMMSGKLSALKPGEYGIILGRSLADALDVKVGDKVTVVAPEATVTPAGILPRLRRFTVVGIFEIGMHEYDSSLALIHIDDAARLFRVEHGVTGLLVMTDDIYSAPAIVRDAVAKLPGNFWVIDWTQQHANFFRALQTEKTVMFIILALIVAVAAFNIVSTLVMVVTDKQADIAVLMTLGATPRSIMGIFIVQGAIIGLVGTILGVLAGVWLANNVETIVPNIEHLFNVKFLSPDVYYISEVPSDMHWIDVIRISIVAFLLSLLATIYPAWRAARTQPAEALRYE